tara:strand:- start:303 stop:734 length:432 start_codon:yes stop_codon:yes gene_type:complete
MTDNDQNLIWESYMDETVATPQNIARAKMLLHDPDVDDDEREAIEGTLKELERLSGATGLLSAREKVAKIMAKLTDFYFGGVNENREGYAAMDHHEQFSDIAYKYYGDMEEDELRLHHSILEELLEMDELSRREAQGQGPQRD